MRTSVEFLAKERELQAAEASGGAGDAAQSAGLEALAHLAHVMLNANEFVYIN